MEIKMDYSLIIGIITFLSAAVITYFTVKKDRSDKQELLTAKECIMDLQKKVNAKSEYIENLMTGGNSYCYLEIFITENFLTTNTKYLEIISLIHNGNYPLQDIQIYLEKPNLKWKKQSVSGFLSASQDPTLNYTFKIPFLSENRSGAQIEKIPLLVSPIPDEHLVNNNITYLATINLRTGIYKQIYKLALFKHVWLDAHKIYSDYIRNFPPVIKIHEQFPNKNPDGTVDWTLIE